MALRRLTLKDFAIVETLDLEFSEGFSVLTGETGAGKSILIDALQLVLGGRADLHMVREGTSKTEVSAEFEVPHGMDDWLQQAGIDTDDMLLLRRTVDTQARSRAWINGTPVTATQLKQLGESLLDVHGQHAWQGLMQPRTVRNLLDAFGRLSTREVASAWAAWQAKQQELADCQAQQASRQTERDRLQWQINELEKLAPQTHEWAELEEQHQRLSHAEGILVAADTALQHLTEESKGVCVQLGKAIQALARQSQVERSFQEQVEVLSSCLAQIEDARHSLKSYVQHTELDPQRLGEIDTRMAEWVSVARRFRRKPEELPETLAAWHTALAELDQATDLESLAHEVDTLAARYQKAALTLSHARKHHAALLADSVTQRMQTLGMAGGRLEVVVSSTTPSAHGLDEVSFMVATNPGSTPKPLAKIASGGELSRLSLAIAVATSAQGAAHSLIFDEVDSGIGGHVAETVGKLLCALGQHKQVLAVTHLPQIAVFADHHFQVHKLRESHRSVSSVHALPMAERVTEVARMLGGKNAWKTSMAHAQEMLKQARSRQEAPTE